MRKIRTNRKNLNKSVSKKTRVDFIQLTYDQYENILCGNMTTARICNILEVNCEKSFFSKLKSNKLSEYKDWYDRVRGTQQ